MAIPDAEKLHFECKVKGTLAAMGLEPQDTYNIFHYRRTSAAPDVVTANLLLAIQAKVETPWLAAASVHWTLEEYVVRCINDPTDAGSTLVTGDPGLVAGEALPGFNNMLINKHTAFRGRRFMGRMFVCGIAEGGADGNTLTAAQLILLNALAAALDDSIVDADGNTFNPFLFSPSPPSQIENYPTTVNGADITQCIGSDPIAILKSRKSRS